MSILTIDEAKAKNHKKFYMLLTAIGDQLLLLYAAQIYYLLTGEKVLIGVTSHDIIFHNYKFCDILLGFNPLTIAGKNFMLLDAAGIKAYSLTYRTAPPKISPDGYCFQKIHIIAQLLAQMGFSGQAPITPRLTVHPKYKAFGRFYKNNQIAIISRGKERRKTYGFLNTQKIINNLRGTYNFVQIGMGNDPLLNGVTDLRGKLSIHEVAAVLKNSDIFVGGIGFLQHLARGVKCRSVITYSNSEPLWSASYPCNINVIAKKSCDLCQYSPIDSSKDTEQCAYDFSCIKSIDVDDVCAAIVKLMNANTENFLEFENIFVRKREINALTFMTARITRISSRSGHLHSQSQLSNDI